MWQSHLLADDIDDALDGVAQLPPFDTVFVALDHDGGSARGLDGRCHGERRIPGRCERLARGLELVLQLGTTRSGQQPELLLENSFGLLGGQAVCLPEPTDRSGVVGRVGEEGGRTRQIRAET